MRSVLGLMYMWAMHMSHFRSFTCCSPLAALILALAACGDSRSHGIENEGVESVAVGDAHACALLRDGTVKCWGDNTYGQFGDGTTTQHRTPTATLPLGGRAVAIAAGAFHTCAVIESGNVMCWGAGSVIGDGTTMQRSTPTATRPLGGKTVAIAAAQSHTCALLEEGDVKCWGRNLDGQLGDGTRDRRDEPTATRPLGGRAIAIAANTSHTCALLDGGGITCWGGNDQGQLGDGTTAPRLEPGATLPLEGRATAITAGTYHSCALLEDGNVKCWGAGGLLGDGTTTQRSAPTATLALGGKTTAIASSGSHTCALIEDRNVKCWGDNSSGQLGDGTTTQRQTPTATLPVGGGITSLSLGWYVTCVVLDNERVKCWGDNFHARLGDGLSAEPRPMRTALSEPASQLAAGSDHTCALLEGGDVTCWGRNNYGQLGDGTTTLREAPTATLPLGGPAIALAASPEHTCALLEGGDVKCWGSNNNGQFGDGTTMWRETPTASLSLGAQAIALTAGTAHTCALLEGGDVKCWGYNPMGQLGDGTTTQRSSPTPPLELGGQAIAIAAGAFHTCALLDDGNVKCWGGNGNGQLGDGTTTQRLAPTATLPLGNQAIAIAAGGSHTCALLDGGDVVCWGSNTGGELGDGSTMERLAPTATLSLGGQAASIAAGVGHTCALLEGGDVKCWGWNDNGQLGDETWENRGMPTATLPLGEEAISLTVGRQHTCAVLDGGDIACWGDNLYGELGIGVRPLGPPDESIAL